MRLDVVVKEPLRYDSPPVSRLACVLTSPTHTGTTAAGEPREGAGQGNHFKSKVAVAEVPLVRLINMLKGTLPKWGLQLEPDQVGACVLRLSHPEGSYFGARQE